MTELSISAYVYYFLSLEKRRLLLLYTFLNSICNFSIRHVCLFPTWFSTIGKFIQFPFFLIQFQDVLIFWHPHFFFVTTIVHTLIKPGFLLFKPFFYLLFTAFSRQLKITTFMSREKKVLFFLLHNNLIPIIKYNSQKMKILTRETNDITLHTWIWQVHTLFFFFFYLFHKIVR